MDILNIKTPNQQTSCVLFQTQGGSTLSQNRLEKTNYSKGSKGSEYVIVYYRVFGAPKKFWAVILSWSQNILRTKTKVWQCYINNENKNTIKD